ncbi:MAG TPA: PIG-L family deacetylase [Flavisolibacter sp.]|nr:PIG-L family deacetylase [Flavisolibacter sp.]
MKQICLTALACLQLCFAQAQTPAFPTSGDIYLGLKELNVLGSVLYIAAHPDDENTRLLTYFAKDRLYRTGYLSLTRGDGGQNLIGEEQGIELGLIRTQELLAARRIDGAEQFFTRAYDFGFSKTPQETFSKWDKEKILSDVVWVIRKFQPDVIITRFPTTGEGGHGHHTASAMLGVEAFTAAADPKRFPEQLKFVQPWKATRILWNSFNFGSVNTTSADQFQMEVGNFNPVIGKSYGEIAAESRSQHKSQGFGVPRGRGEATEFFKSLNGPEPTTDLFENINTGWERVRGGEQVAQLINTTIASFDFLQPQKSVPALVQVYKALKAMPDNYWKVQKLKEVKELVSAASGLWAEAIALQPSVVQGDSVQINTVLNNRLGANILVKRIHTQGFDTTLSAALAKNKNIVVGRKIAVPSAKELTQPYWLRETMKEGYFEVKDQQLIGEPDVEKAFTVDFSLVVEGEEIALTRPVQYKYNDPVKGEIYQPFFVFPAATVSLQPPILVLKKDGEKKPLTLYLTAQKNLNSSAEAHIRSAAVDSTKQPVPVSIPARSSHPFTFSVGSENLQQRKEDKLFGSVALKNGKEEATAYLSMRSINYDHIPSINYFFGSSVKLLNVDLKTEGKRIGYIVGAGDKVPEALEQMGYEVTLLTAKEMARNNLEQFDAIISGVRAYNTADWLNTYYEKLMHYVENGGNLIVQYNTSNQIGPVRAKMGPYNFGISRARITDENAAVTFLKPEHPVMNYPNKITKADFDGWVQERSIYHAENWDNNFEPIFRMADAGETPNDGSLIIAKHGKGFFTYTGLVFFRELPAGVPGAYRLMANLIALNKIKGS